ncbi:MAG: hypothetical protein KC492_09040 [Myxococcales bacterium]|nr:hypothetical protein [Myxococcales bacterium]
MPDELSELSKHAKGLVASAVQAALAIDAPAFEEEGDVAVLHRLARVALEQTREAYGAISERLDNYSGDRPRALVRLADAVFVGRFALGGLSGELKRAETNKDSWSVIRAASKVRRELLRSLRSADLLACQVLGCEPETEYYLDELQQALAARRAYAKLRTEASRTNERDVELSIRRAATTLAKLVGRECYPELRIHDRMLVRQLQRQMREWLAGDKVSEVSILSGQRLLGEYHNFVEIALEVNKRPELLEHDQLMLTQLLATWDELTDEEVLREARVLMGRDAELDEALGRKASRLELRVCLEQLLARIGGKVSAGSWVVERAHPVSKLPESQRRFSERK